MARTKAVACLAAVLLLVLATLAAIAVDPKIDNIAPSAGATAKVEAIARAG